MTSYHLFLFFLVGRFAEEMQSNQAPQVDPLQTVSFPTCGHNVIPQSQSSEVEGNALLHQIFKDALLILKFV